MSISSSCLVFWGMKNKKYTSSAVSKDRTLSQEWGRQVFEGDGSIIRGLPSQEFHYNEWADCDPCRQAHPQKQPISESLLRPPAFCSCILPKEFSKTFLVNRKRWKYWLMSLACVTTTSRHPLFISSQGLCKVSGGEPDKEIWIQLRICQVYQTTTVCYLNKFRLVIITQLRATV